VAGVSEIQKDARAIYRSLSKRYPNVRCELDFRNPLELMVAVVLSAQCTDERVNKVTPSLFALADNPLDMSKVPVAKIKEIIRPCGLSPKKSEAISGLSNILIDKFNVQVPDTFEDLESLPGVGHKTASVVMSQAFGVPAFPVDTHIHRLATRWGLTSGKNVEETERDLKLLFPKKIWNKLHLQIIFYGRSYCPARGHIIEKCPICNRFGV
jgi:endonuclease-3